MLVFIGIIIIFTIGLFLKNSTSIFREGFTWSKQSVHDFLKFQDTINYNTQFNMEMIQQQASEEELHELLEKGSWPWSQETENEYMYNVSRNTMLRIQPAVSMQIEKTVYNERAMQQLLGWNTKEGQFLLNGSLINDSNGNGTIQCTTNEEGKTALQKKVLTGYNTWNGYTNYEVTDLTNENIPQNVPGFQFVKGPCNPCVALDNDYSCPFQIATQKEGNTVSDIWKKLWNI
jgi:hypothetical protein